jgi:two-component system cell cycle response regulator DivK
MKRILIVEDAEYSLDLLVQLLEDSYHVLTAADGATAVVVARRELPDLIIMDLSLPGISGWEVSRLIKTDPTLQHIPVIALSAHAMLGDEERALQCGCDDYLSKPFDENLLFEKLRSFLGTSWETVMSSGMSLSCQLL